jgi:ribokinase
VDTTGAGDAFVGYLAAGVDVGMPLAEAARRAVVAGALACTGMGAQSAIPTAADVEAFLSSPR